MKDYIVQNIYTLPVCYNEYFLVKANNKNAAIDRVYKEYGEEFSKKDFKAYTLDDIYKLSDTGGFLSVIR